MHTHTLQTASGNLFVSLDESGLNILRGPERELLMTSRGLGLFQPVFAGVSAPPTVRCVRSEAALAVVSYDLDGVSGLELFIEARESAIDFWVQFVAGRDCEINALKLFPENTGLNFYDLVNFRNRHRTDRTWPELVLGHSFETTTFSDDWQFAPHPTAMLFRKSGHSLFTGFLDLQPTFGMKLKVEKNLVKNWELDYGKAPHGLKLRAGEKFRSGRLRLFTSDSVCPYEVFTSFGRMLIDEGSIPDPALKQRAGWWTEPLYCTWNDQTLLADSEAETELVHQTAGKVKDVIAKLDEAMVWRAVDVIRRESLPIRTIILDEGWNKARGDWQPHPQRFPNLRKLVDDLHRLGFKVMVWWSWAEIAPGADVPEWQLAGRGWKNRHGSYWRDYSDPRIQEEYFKPLMRTLFSSEAGCYDLDGIKTDFLADKVHPDTCLHDPAWRGEEMYFYRLTEMFYREMRRHKPDALHLGCAGHFWLAQFIDLNRTYDVHSTNWLEHEERARMLMCTSPGVPVSYDMMIFSENTDKYFASAAKLGAAVEIGNVLIQKDNIFSETRPVDEAYLDLLREGCLATGGKPLSGIDRGDEQNADHPDNQPISSLA